MSVRHNPTPSYLLHKQSGRARAVWTDRIGNRQQRLLPGAYESPESRTAFARLQLEIVASPAWIRTKNLAVNSPELNSIEPVFKQVKHHEMPTRSFTTRTDLRKVVEDGFETYRRRLQAKGNNELRLAA